MRNRFPTACSDCGDWLQPDEGDVIGKDPVSCKWRVRFDSCFESREHRRNPRSSCPPPRNPSWDDLLTDPIIAARIRQMEAERDCPPCLRRLGLRPPVNADQVRQQYRRLALKCHPDHGGDNRTFIELKAAYDQALRLAGVAT